MKFKRSLIIFVLIFVFAPAVNLHAETFWHETVRVDYVNGAKIDSTSSLGAAGWQTSKVAYGDLSKNVRIDVLLPSRVAALRR